jgi:hypothetical protein
MQGASALGQGIAALGSGVGAGIKQRKQHEKEVTATTSRLELLKKTVPEGSPLGKMLQHGIDTLSNSDLSPREAAARAAGFNQGIDDHWTKTEMELKQAAGARDADVHGITRPALVAEAGMRAALPEASFKAESDLLEFKGNQQGLVARMRDRIQAMTDPAGWQQKQEEKQSTNAALLLEFEEAKAYGQGLVEELQEEHGLQQYPGMEIKVGAEDLLPDSKLKKIQEILTEQPPLAPIIPGEIQPAQPSTDLGGGTGGVLPPKQPTGPTGQMRAAAYLQELNSQQGDVKYGSKSVPIEGKQVEVLTIDNIPQTGMAGTSFIPLAVGEKTRMYATPAEQLTFQEQSSRLAFDQKTQQERLETVHDKEVLASNYVEALNLLKGSDREDPVYTGLGASMKMKFERLGSVLGIDNAKLSVANAQQLYSLLGDGIMAQIQKTKGAVSEKEMAFFALISPGIDKEPLANQRLLQHQLKFLKREIEVARLTRKLRHQGLGVAEIERSVGDYYDTNRILTDEEIRSALEGEGIDPDAAFADYRRPGQKPSRHDTSVPGEGRMRAEGLGARLEGYSNPQAPVPPGPGAAATHPAALPSNNPFVLTSPHTNQPIDLSHFSDNFPPSGTLMKDPTAPNKFFRIP